MNETIKTKQLTVDIQDNGIIRAPNGRLIARLVDDIQFNSEHLSEHDNNNKPEAASDVHSNATPQQYRGRLFQDELEELINKYSQENMSDTPDFILAEYLKMCLDAFNHSVQRREGWYGRVSEKPVDITIKK